MNKASWIILVILIMVLSLVIAYLIKNRKRGCSSCGKESCPFRKKINK